VGVNSITFGFIIDPFPFKHVAINVPEFSLATGFILKPVSFITSTIRPDLDSMAMF
jgi:hypothetical protein